MGNGYHSTTIVGYVGKDPEVKYISKGTAIAKFSVGVSESYKSGDEWKQTTEWYNVVVWGKNAERIESGEIPIVKGKQVTIIGKMHTDSWEAKDGTKKYQTNLKADHVLVAPNGDQRAAKPQQDQLPISDDDIPF